VMVANTREPVPARQAMMADVARAVVAVHDGIDPTTLPVTKVDAATPAPVLPPPSKIQGKKRSAHSPHRHQTGSHPTRKRKPK